MTTHKHTPTTPDVPVTTPSTDAATQALLLMTPPVLDLPRIPTGPLASGADFRGVFPRNSEAAALPDVVLEVSTSTDYASTFGPSMPAAAPFAALAQIASDWTTQCARLEAYLAHAKAQEGLAWRALRPHLKQARGVYETTFAKNSEVPVLFPALTRLLDVNTTVAKKGNATRKRKEAAEEAKAAASSTTSPTTSPSTIATPATGGGAR